MDKALAHATFLLKEKIFAARKEIGCQLGPGPPLYGFFSNGFLRDSKEN
jgi:hypothetical protein